MKDCGVSVDKTELDQFFAAIEGKTIPELVAAGEKKLVSMPSGGGARAPAAGGAAGAGEAQPEAKEEEVEAVDMGGLFDDDEY
jgi:large subunit ribosomal protein LP2